METRYHRNRLQFVFVKAKGLFIFVLNSSVELFSSTIALVETFITLIFYRNRANNLAVSKSSFHFVAFRPTCAFIYSISMPFQTMFPFSVNGSRNQESSSTTSKDAPSPADKVTNVLQSRALEDRATSSTTPRNSRPLANELLGAHPADFVPQEYTTTKAAAKPRRGEESDSKFYSSMCEFISGDFAFICFPAHISCLGRLYFDSIQSLPFKVPEDAHIFTIDQDFNYVPFYAGIISLQTVPDHAHRFRPLEYVEFISIL